MSGQSGARLQTRCTVGAVAAPLLGSHSVLLAVLGCSHHLSAPLPTCVLLLAPMQDGGAGADPNRVGGPVNHLLSDGGMSTMIGGGKGVDHALVREAGGCWPAGDGVLGAARRTVAPRAVFLCPGPSSTSLSWGRSCWGVVSPRPTWPVLLPRPPFPPAGAQPAAHAGAHRGDDRPRGDCGVPGDWQDLRRHEAAGHGEEAGGGVLQAGVVGRPG